MNLLSRMPLSALVIQPLLLQLCAPVPRTDGVCRARLRPALMPMTLQRGRRRRRRRRRQRRRPRRGRRACWRRPCGPSRSWVRLLRAHCAASHALAGLAHACAGAGTLRGLRAATVQPSGGGYRKARAPRQCSGKQSRHASRTMQQRGRAWLPNAGVKPSHQRAARCLASHKL